jgi:hypothetical protein
VYDEHGGFYDHVPPPTAARVSDDFPIDTFGLRVPAFVVSPWVAAGSVFGSDADLRHFDHTSILKTIARRFLGTPPYLGARYAAANDLSSVLTSQLRMPLFLPYIRYRVQHMSSQWMLDAGSVHRVPGAVLRHDEEHGLVTQDFCFEATEGGNFYIRVCATGLYVSVSVSDDAADESIGLMLIQDVKYAPTSSDIVSAGSPELQKWQFSRASAAPGETDRYIVSNQAFPNRVMQPGHHGDAVVLSQVSADTNAAWNVTSPLIN